MSGHANLSAVRGSHAHVKLKVQKSQFFDPTQRDNDQ
jgi:hypothetical protein